MKIQFYLTLLSIVCLLKTQGQAQDFNLPVFSFTQLSDTYVTAMAEDEDGFIWIGTQKGLNRYNGSTYRIYYHHPDSLSLTSDNIISLLPDTDHRLWVGTYSGINLIQNGKVARRSALEPWALPVYPLHKATRLHGSTNQVPYLRVQPGFHIGTYYQSPPTMRSKQPDLV